MFDRLLTRLLGGSFSGRHLFIQVDPTLSIPGLFSAAVSSEGGYLDQEMLQNLSDIVMHLMDKQRAEAKAVTARRIQGLLEDVKTGNIQPEHFRNHVEREMTETWDRIASGVERVVNTESQHALTMGLKEGIEQMAFVRGVADPAVVFIVKNDAALCDECRKVHLMPDEHTPRVWLNSEVSSDYHVRGEFRPSWHRMHPHCRCTLATVLPGFGFNGAGRVTYIREGWVERDYQQARGDNLGGVEERRAWKK